jgi:hypothetical protein
MVQKTMLNLNDRVHTELQCQGRRTRPNLGYVARSRRPSSPVRLDPSTAGLRENKRLGKSFLASSIDEVLDIYIAGLLQDSN